MNGVATRPPGLALPATAPSANGASDDVSTKNAVRISTTCENLFKCAQYNHPDSTLVFGNLCISLSRGIDFGLINNEKPAETSSLLKVCKLVCQRRNDCNLQAPIMVLMATLKHACKAQWFSAKESQEILALAEEVTRIFNTHEGISFEQANINSTISQIASRYFPWIKVVHVIASVDIKPGFEACAVDFHLTKKMPYSSRKIGLLVAMKGNIDTSSCIITPQKVNIMLNGRGVRGRVFGQMELGPLAPTNVSHMLKFGTNLLQAVGDFDAHYVVLIAFMSDVPSSSLPVPEDYTQPASVTLESDAEVVVGPSRVSLNCPISCARIKMPVKGKLCKHLQCFDLSSYVELNRQCPSWKCPHCNQPTCYPDIRIDKKLAMILQEVAESVESVIIQSDGLWEAVSGNDGHNRDEPNAKPTEALQAGSDQPMPSEFSNEPSNMVDLTEGDDGNIVIIDDDMPEDTKPMFQSDRLNTVAGNPSELNRNSATQIQGFSGPGPLEILSGQADYSTRTNVQPVGGASHFTPAPVLPDSLTPAVMQRLQAYMGTNQQSSPRTGVPSAINAMQLQQAPLQQTESVNRGHQWMRNVTRVPNATQALPAMRPRSSPMVSTRPALNNSSGIPSAMNNFSGNTSPIPGNTSLPPAALNSASATRRDTFRQNSPAQMGGLTSPGQATNQPRPSTPVQVLNNSFFRPNSSSQVTNQPRSTAPVQTTPNNSFRSNSSPQIANQPRSTTPAQVPINNTPRPNSSPQIANQPRSTTPAQVPSNNTPRPNSSPQITNQPRPTLSVEIPNDNSVPNSSPQIANQTRPSSQIPPYMISTPPHLRARAQAPPGGSANLQQYRPILPPPSATSAQQAGASRPRPLPTTPIQIQTSKEHPASVPSVGPRPPGRTVVSRTQDLVDVQSSEQNWQPSGRMRGSITGRALSENFSQYVIRPTHETTPNPLGQSPTQASNMASELSQTLNGSSSSQPNPSQNING